MKSTGPATAREASRAGRASPLSRRMGALLPLVLSAALLMLGLPRLVSTVATLPYESQLKVLQAGRDLTESELRRLDRRWSVAHRFSSSGEIPAELAAIKLAQADQLPERAASEHRALIGNATALLEESLAEGPANAVAWARLAYARSLAQETGGDAVAAWRMSVLTAPADLRLLVWRSRFGLSRIAQLAQGDRDLLDAQIRLAWRYDRKGFVRFARESGPDAVQILRGTLIGQPEDMARFEDSLR